ncbi:WD40-repeat-containing domain protein [Chytridium lagenaria]|nr:WD40-repeat-containing domain protein [Chytridium lagenaria]
MLPDLGSKIHDFVAHSSSVTCLKISPKSGRIMVTGGEDRKVNLWAVGKTSAILSLTGHSSSIESVTLDWPEEIVVAGSSSGSIKLWDLEHSKVIRTLLGHNASVRSVEFHPFGEFFASGSVDAVVKIWDVRKKGCIQTYSGHRDAITNLRITPDGRWIATGGADGMIKLRFYDLQTFELVSESPTLSSPPCSLEFHPDGHEVMVACRDSLQIWTWEPAFCHDTASLNWPNITDIRALPDGKLIGAAKDQNVVSVWGVDLSRLRPYKVDLDSSTQAKESENSLPSLSSFSINPVEGNRPLSAQKDRPASPAPRNNSFDPVRAVTTPQDHHIVQSSTSFSRQSTPTDTRPASRQMRRAKSSTSLKDDRVISEPPSAKKAPFILGSSGDKPLNLDISNFIQEPHFRAYGLRHAWDEGDLKSAMETLSTCRDPAVWIDILRVMNLKPKLLTLEIATILLPLLNELLFEVYEDYIITACTTVRILCKSFAQVIIAAVSPGTFSSPGLDFAREERLQRCRSCQSRFQDISLTLQELKRAPGRVGLAVRETLTELQVFT